MKIENKQLLIDKMKSGEWKTPFYFYDLNLVEKNYRQLQDAVSERFKIFYSMKSNPHSEVLKKLKSLGCLLDISSLGEMKKALEAGFTGKQLSFVGPGKSEEELIASIENEIEYIVIESFQELQIFARLTKERNKSRKFCIRIHPDNFIQNNGHSKTMAPSHFGFDEAEVLSLKEFVDKNKHIQFAGLHFYLQAQYLNSSHILENFKSFAEITLKLQQHFNLSFEMINWGGGFGIPYFQGQELLDTHELKKEIHRFLVSEKMQQLKNALFYVESGRFISGPAGFFVTKILYTKKSHGKSYAICDGGMTQHQSAIGIGQVIRRNFPMFAITQTESSEVEKINLAGPSCYSIDILATEVELPKLNPGDHVVIGQSGAYGPTFSPENFLSRPRANEYTNE